MATHESRLSSNLDQTFKQYYNTRSSTFLPVKKHMSATPSTEAIVNPTLVRVNAGGAAEGSWTRSGGRLVKTDVFRVSASVTRYREGRDCLGRPRVTPWLRPSCPRRSAQPRRSRSRPGGVGPALVPESAKKRAPPPRSRIAGRRACPGGRR
jgi:hypothetical protein